MSTSYHLHAGPIRLKYQDGELRYLYVGEREILRRVYFAVRDANWDTAMPVSLTADVQASERSFHITLEAVCRNPLAEYRWSGEITGTEDGAIIFTITGKALADFASPRIGLCMLFGTPTLAGQEYEVIDAAGHTTSGVFPANVDPELLQPLNSFHTLRYRADGMTVSAGLPDGAFGMEDQRNYGDSSYKAMSGMDYPYPDIRAGATGRQTFMLRVIGATNEEIPVGPARVIIGEALPYIRLPKLVASNAEANFAKLTACNWDPAKFPATNPLVLPYSPGLHLFDNDTYLENIPTVVDWAHTLRVVMPGVPIRLDPITLNAPYPRSSDDPRIGTPFADAWTLRMLKYVALAGIEEAAFAFDNPLLRRLGALANAPLRSTAISSPTVEALAIDADGQRYVWLVNLADEPQEVEIEGAMYMLRNYEALKLK